MKLNRKKHANHTFLRMSKGGSIRFTVQRHTAPGAPTGFWVCAKVGSGDTTTGRRNSMCAKAKTPRKALAMALRKLAKATETRSGTFKRMRR